MVDVISIPHRSSVVKTRRGYALLLLGFLIPGSAQALYGRRKLGRFAIKLWMFIVLVVILTGVASFFFRTWLFDMMANNIVQWVLFGVGAAVASFWIGLTINTWWIARPAQMGARKGIIFSVVSLLTLAMVCSLAYGAYLVKTAVDTINQTTTGGCGLGCIFHQVGNLTQQNNTKPLQADAHGRTNILMLGTSDDRPDEDSGGQWLTDSIMILSVSQQAKDAYMVSIPRDLWVRYPDNCEYGNRGKVNVVYMCNGGGKNVGAARTALAATIPTFETVTGLDIQYAININYSVLRDLVNAVGGYITVTIVSTDPRGIWDINTGLKLPAGTVTIDAETALALAKARNSDGGYGLEQSNFNREQNQQAIIKGLVQQAQANSFFTNAAGMTTALTGLGNNLRSTFSADDVSTLMKLAVSMEAENFHSINLLAASPAIIGTPMIDGQSAVAPVAGTYDYSELRRYIATAMSETSVATEAAVVDVLNATNKSGWAASNASDLTDAGFTVGHVGDYAGTDPGATQIFQLTDGNPLTAAALAKQYKVAVTPGPVPQYTSQDDADFVVVLG